MQHVKNFGQTDSKAYYSFDDVSNHQATQNDTEGCLLHDGDKKNVWLVHNDSTRNWVSQPTPGCFSNSLDVADINIYDKRHGGSGAYSLNTAQSKVACTTNKACSVAPAASSGAFSGMHYVVLNGDFNAKGEAWYDIDSQTTKFSWAHPWLPSEQMEWLQQDLATAKSNGQKAIVFIHYRLDGGLGMNQSAWVDDCTLDNAGVLRAVLEESGIVLATFSGHDHAPKPDYTVHNGIFYFTHKAMVEGTFPASNAFSVIEVLDDCTVVVHGFKNATSANHSGAPGCTVRHNRG
jgi:hypothetical protein